MLYTSQNVVLDFQTCTMHEHDYDGNFGNLDVGILFIKVVVRSIR